MINWDKYNAYKPSEVEYKVMMQQFEEWIDGHDLREEMEEHMSQPEVDMMRNMFEAGWKLRHLFTN